jgi:hypothetical protein
MSDEAITVEQFCRRYVEPMGEESDHVHIVALTDALQAAAPAPPPARPRRVRRGPRAWLVGQSLMYLACDAVMPCA